LLQKYHRGINIEPQLLVGLDIDDLVEVQELGVVFNFGRQKGNQSFTGAEHIEAMSPFTMNDNALVIGDEFIAGLNAVCRVAIDGMLEEREFPVGILVDQIHILNIFL